MAGGRVKYKYSRSLIHHLQLSPPNTLLNSTYYNPHPTPQTLKMGGGDLNMKKSWHPALLVNQEKVWKAEKASIEEKKALQQLRKEREEERQLAELQRMQEASTGKKRVEKLDWMYAAPGGEGGMGRFSERELEDYLLGKKRVDEMLRAGDQDVSREGRR